MTRGKANEAACSICGKILPRRDLVAGHVLRQVLASLREHELLAANVEQESD